MYGKIEGFNHTYLTYLTLSTPYQCAAGHCLQGQRKRGAKRTPRDATTIRPARHWFTVASTSLLFNDCRMGRPLYESLCKRLCGHELSAEHSGQGYRLGLRFRNFRRCTGSLSGRHEYRCDRQLQTGYHSDFSGRYSRYNRSMFLVIKTSITFKIRRREPKGLPPPGYRDKVETNILGAASYLGHYFIYCRIAVGDVVAKGMAAGRWCMLTQTIRR